MGDGDGGIVGFGASGFGLGAAFGSLDWGSGMRSLRLKFNTDKPP
jgi:hypothetical protein